MEDIFKPSSLTIKELFGNADSMYQIPRYQRPYSWVDEQLEKLWDDLTDALENEPNYFLGSLITAKPEEKSNYLDIVDGQQRLTTLTILMCVYRDLYPKINNNLIETDPFAIDIKTVEMSIRFNDRFERLRLRTHSNHQSKFESLILLKGKATTHKKPNKKDLKKDEPSFKFMNTASFFTQKLDELGEVKAGELLNYIFNSVKIIRIDCQTVSFAIKLFQVLNDRGLDLSNSDLIKSYLIGRVQSIYKDPEDRQKREDQFMDDWKACETIAVDTEYSLNDLFVMYEYYLFASNPKKGLYDELIKDFQLKNPIDILSDFKDFSNHYKNEIFNSGDKVIFSFKYLRWGVYWRTIITAAHHNNYSDQRKLSKMLLRYYYLNWIAGHTLTKIKQISFNVIKWVKEGVPLERIKNELEKNLKDNNTVKKAQDNLEGDIYFEAWCKPLLAMIEYNQVDNSNRPFIDIWNRNIHAEHILPKAFKQKKEWEHFNNDENIEDWIDSGANLTLLSGSKNISASNDGFLKKIKAYNGQGFENKNTEKVTSFVITQKIVTDYNNGSFNKEWNWDALYDRWNWFCDQMEEILEIDMSESRVDE